MRWNDIENIAEALEENYHDEKIEKLKLADLHELVISLEDFDDDRDYYGERVLNAILETWMEMRQTTY